MVSETIPGMEYNHPDNNASDNKSLPDIIVPQTEKQIQISASTAKASSAKIPLNFVFSSESSCNSRSVYLSSSARLLM